MTLNSSMVSLMDKARSLTGLTDKISIDHLTRLMDHFDLHVNPNLLDKTEFTVKADPTNPYFSLLQIYNSNVKGTYTFSWKAKTDGNAKGVRVAIFNWELNKALGHVDFPLTFKQQFVTFTIPSSWNSFVIFLYASGSNEVANAPVTYYDCKLEVGDLATPITTVGGVIKRLLYSLVTQKIGGACYVA